MKKFVREPLVHFLMIGLGIFLLFELVSDDTPAQDTIVLADNDLQHLVEIWKLQWQREPTAQELIGLIEERIKQEVLYREALKMNLDHDDEVVKRRLAQKMDFLSSDISAMVNKPSDDDLKAYLEKYTEKYQLPYRYTFRHMVFLSENHRNPQEAADQVLKALDKHNGAVDDLGDNLSIRREFESIEADRLTRELGTDFSSSLEELPLGEWAGPVRSGYGWHLVYMVERQEPSVPPFEDVRAALQRDYAYEKEQESQQLIYEELRKRYDIELQASLSAELSELIRQKIDG